MYLILNVEMDSGCIELIGKTNDEEVAKYYRDNYDADFNSMINYINTDDIGIVDKDNLNDTQRYFVYNQQINLKRVNHYFEMQELKEDSQYRQEFFNTRKFDILEEGSFEINFVSHSRNELDVYIRYTTDDENLNFNSIVNPLLPTIQFILTQAKKADIRSKDKIRTMINQLGGN